MQHPSAPCATVSSAHSSVPLAAFYCASPPPPRTRPRGRLSSPGLHPIHRIDPELRRPVRRERLSASQPSEATPRHHANCTSAPRAAWWQSAGQYTT